MASLLLYQKSCRKNNKNVPVCPFLEKLPFAMRKQGFSCGAAVWWQSRAHKALCYSWAVWQSILGPSHCCVPQPPHPGETTPAGGARTVSYLEAEHKSAADHIKGVIMAFVFPKVCLWVSGNRHSCLLEWWMSIMSCILPWLLLESRGPGSESGVKFLPPLCITFLLSHLEGSWSGCGAALAPFQPSWKPKRSYCLLGAFGRGPFSTLSL